MESAATAQAVPLPVQPIEAQPAAKTAVAKSNVLVEVMEGVTLSALLILFTYLFMVGGLFLTNGVA